MRSLLIAIPILSACSGSGSVGVDNNSSADDCLQFFGEDCSNTSGTNGSTGTVVGTEDPGSGPGVGLWGVDAEASGVRVADGGGALHFETDIRVDLEDESGQPATGRALVIQTALLGDRDLVEDPGNPGRYEADMLGYARTFTLVVEPDSPVERFETTAVGPGIHDLTIPGGPLDITEDHTITWAPSGASFARVDTRGGGNRDVDDTGAFTIEAISMDYELGCAGEERVEVRRWEILDVTNAVSGSSFEVSIEVRDDDVDTSDSRRSDLDGEVVLDNDFDGMTGDVYVMLLPSKLDPEDEPFWHWTKIEDANFVDQGDYGFVDLAPGDWYGIAYLDADGSDANGVPSGPTEDDPFDDRDLTIDPGVDSNRDFDLRDRW